MEPQVPIRLRRHQWLLCLGQRRVSEVPAPGSRDNIERRYRFEAYRFVAADARGAVSRSRLPPRRVLAAGCEKKEEAPPVAEQPAPVRQQGLSAPASDVPQRPDPDVPKGAVPDYPKAGQVNNHSSPEFKGGGTSDKK